MTTSGNHAPVDSPLLGVGRHANTSERSLDRQLIDAVAVQIADPLAALDKVKALLAKGANADFDNGEALVRAAGANAYQMCELLLDHGATFDGCSHLALQCAIGGRCFEVSRLLLTRGSDPRFQSLVARKSLLRELPAADVETARLLFPEWGTGQIADAARETGNTCLAASIEACAVRESASRRLARRRSISGPRQWASQWALASHGRAAGRHGLLRSRGSRFERRRA